MYAASIAAVFLIFLLVAGLILLVVFYLLNLQNVLKEIQPSNRLVEPGNVWLMFIPLFNLIYPLILYPRICDSIKNEYNSRGINAEGDFGRAIGITMGVLGLCGLIPVLGVLAGIAQLILFIVFWVKMAGFKEELRKTVKGDGLSSNPDLLD